MSKFVNILKSFQADESGATIIEYSLLIGLLTVAVVATIIVVGTWVANQWTALTTAIAG